MSYVSHNLGKTFAEWELDDLIYAHVGGCSAHPSDVWLNSTLPAIEENMRHSRSFEKSRTFNPSLCAFAILDQLGSTYADTAVSAGTKTTPILAALHNFCDIQDTSAEAHHLYMFRNAIVHDASMTGVWAPRGVVRGHYIFRYSDDLTRIVQPSSRPWDGTYADICDDTISLINQKMLVDMVSDAIRKVSKLFHDRRQDMKVLADENSIRTRYLVWIVRGQEPKPFWERLSLK